MNTHSEKLMILPLTTISEAGNGSNENSMHKSAQIVCENHAQGSLE